MRLLKRLWNEEDGFVLSTEVVMVGSLLTVGIVTGATAVRDAAESELSEVGAAIGSMNQTYSYSGVRGHSAFTAGSAYYDRLNCQAVAQAPVVTGRPTVCADVFGTAPVAPATVAVAPGPIAEPVPATTTAPAPMPANTTGVISTPAPTTAPCPQPCTPCVACVPCVPTCVPSLGCGSPCGSPCGNGCGCGQHFGYGYGHAGYGHGHAYGYGFPYGYGQPFVQGAIGGANAYATFRAGSALGCNPCGVNPCGCNPCGPNVPLVIPRYGVPVGIPTATPATEVPTSATPSAPTPAPAPAPSGSAAWEQPQAAPANYAVGGSRYYAESQNRFAQAAAAPVKTDQRPTRFGDNDLQGLAGLTHLYLLEVTDAGLVKLAGLDKLESLHVLGPQITDAGLAALESLGNLKELHLIGATVTDAGLQRLQGMKQLRVLDLRATQVTSAGVSQLSQSLPLARIVR